MLVVPLVLTIVLPSVFVIGSVVSPETISDFQVLLDMLPITAEGNEQQLVLGLLLNKIMQQIAEGKYLEIIDDFD